MKTKRSLVVGCLTALLGVGAAVGAGFAAEKTPVKEAEAAASYKTFFIDCTACPDWDSQSLCIHTWNGSSDVYIEATKVSDNYWTVRMDTTGCSGYRWYRCKAGNTGTRWNESGWNGTISNNYCAIKGWDSDASFSGSTSGCEEEYEVASTTPSDSTKRVWVDPKGNFYDGNARAALRVFGDGITTKNYILGGSTQYVNMTHESSTQYYFYVDIPVSADCQLVRLHNAFNFIWTYSADFSAITSWNPTLFMYSWDAAASLSAGGLDSSSNYTVEFAEKFMDGYSTCNPSSVNGYGAYSAMNTNVLSKLGSTKLSQLRSATFSDSTYGTRTYGEKIDRMQHAGKLSSPIVPAIFGSIQSEESKATIWVIVISAITLLGVGGFFFIKRRKHDR